MGLNNTSATIVSPMLGAETHILCNIKGKVQGVRYRAWTRETANHLGVRGWVTNESDGSVTAYLIGTRESVSAMIEQCQKGSPLSDVSDITTHSAPDVDTRGHEGFTIRY